MKTIFSSRRDRYLAIFTIFLVMVALIAGMVGCGGNGEEEEEEEEEPIETWLDLNNIRNNLGGTYYLANNLDSTTPGTPGYGELASSAANGGKGWEPIGTENQPFTGSFDGQGCTITGLFISRPDEDYVGLFGYVKRGVVKNVGLVEVDVTGRNETGALVGHNKRGIVGNDLKWPDSTYSTGRVASYWSGGGLVGCNWDGIVGLCQSSANVSHTSGECYRTGGLVGTNYGDVVYCNYSGNVTGGHEVGGMVGLNGGWVPLAPTGRVISCQGNYTVTGKLFVGGEIGTNLGHLVNAVFEGTVNGKRWKPGSLIALNGGTATNSGCPDTLPDGSCVGGLVGCNKGTIHESIAVSNVSGDTCGGGLVAYNDGTIGASFAAGTVEGTAYFDPLVGCDGPAGTVTDSASVTPGEGMDIDTYEKAGWDICAVAPGGVNTTCTWNIVPGETYPFLSGKPLEQYNLTISSTEGGEVTSPGEGPFTYYEGRVVNLVAEAEECYQFVNWTGDVGTVGNVEDASTIITMDSHYSITANFAREGEEISIPFKNSNTFIEMTIGDAESLDPCWGYDTASGQQVTYIYETLIYWDGTSGSEFVPVLATEWELLPDGVTYRFKIREGVKFHEGGELTPEDVEYSFERTLVQDRSGGPVWMLDEQLLGVYDSADAGFAAIDAAIEVDGDYVVFTLADAAWALPWLQVLAGPWCSILDKEWCVANGEWDGTEATWMDFHDPLSGSSYLWDKTNGTGPWGLEYWDPGIEISLIRFDDYWREPAPFERVITKKVEEWTTRKLAFLAGDADLVYVPLTYIDELVGIDDIQVYTDLPSLTVDSFFFTFDIDPTSDYIGSGALDGEGIPTDFFSDIDVRKGFNYAFDWETYIADGLSGEGAQRGSPVIDGLTYFNPNAKMYSKDFDKAEEHFKAAIGGDVWDLGFKFTLLYNTGNIARKTACGILAENLYSINPLFQVTIQPADWRSVMIPNLVTSKMPMFQIGWMADYPDPDNFVFPFMHSEGTFSHWQAYSNPEVDALIEAGKFELDPAARKDIYYQLQDWYYDDAPGIMLCQPFARRYFTKYIHGFYYNAMNPAYPGPLYYMSKSSS